jgi:hypothetical protein
VAGVYVKGREPLRMTGGMSFQLVESNLVDHFGVRRLKDGEPCIWIREIAKSEILDEVRSLLKSQPFPSASEFEIQVLEAVGIGNLDIRDHEIVKPKTSKSGKA